MGSRRPAPTNRLAGASPAGGTLYAVAIPICDGEAFCEWARRITTRCS
jgi:hypothetical protein